MRRNGKFRKKEGKRMETVNFVSAYIVQGTTGWIVSCLILGSAWGRYKKLFDAIINSFHIL